VADALAAAHRAGLIHRDLKPGNIMLTRAGAKLLDFGLARTTGLASGPGSGITQSPTMSRPLTAEGTIVGTFQYMAPEQLEGKDADARTDIFAFGAVLYEMVGGKRAFEGGSQASLIASILKESPRPLGEFAPMTPPALDHVVRRCLAKHPDDRWQNASDLKHQLEWIRDAGSQAGIPAPVVEHRRQVFRASWMLAIVSSIAAVALGSYLVTHRAAPREAVRFTMLPPGSHYFDGSQTGVAVSPDGRIVAFVAVDSTGAQQLWLRRLDSMEPTTVARTTGALHPFWSPDSRHIGFFAGGKLMRVSLADGNVQVVADAPDPRGGTWGAGGDIVFQPASGGPLYHVRETGGTARAVTAVDTTRGEDAHRFPCFLPDGKHFLYVTLPAVDGTFGVRVGALDGTMTEPILRSGGAAVFAAPDHVVYPRDQQLVVQRFDTGALRVAGDPIPLGEEAGSYGNWTGAPGASVSGNGVLIHSAGGYPNTELAWFDRAGRRTGRISLSPASYGDGAFSRDGSRYAVTAYGKDGASNLWLVDVQRGLATRFTFAAAENYDALWSPDGRDVVFVSNREGRENLFIKPASSAREEARLFDSGTLFTKTEGWSPDGRFIVYGTLTKETGLDLWVYPLDGGAPKPLLATRFNESDAGVSPDGRWMFYRCDETGRSEIYVRSFPDMGEKYRISDNVLGASNSSYFFWIAWVGDEIIYPAADGRTVVSVRVTTGAGFHADPPKAVFQLPLNVFWLAVHPSGTRFLGTGPDTGGLPPMHTVVMNWTRLLPRE
jgi:Tol biopolymer transport system component